MRTTTYRLQASIHLLNPEIAFYESSQQSPATPPNRAVVPRFDQSLHNPVELVTTKLSFSGTLARLSRHNPLETPINGNCGFWAGSDSRNLWFWAGRRSGARHLRRVAATCGAAGHVDTQTVSGSEAEATDRANGLAAVPGHVFAAPEPVGQELSAAGHRAERAPTWRHTVSTVSVRPGFRSIVCNGATVGEPDLLHCNVQAGDG